MRIADGTQGELAVYDFAPLPAYMMALVYKLFSPEHLYIRIVNIIFGTLTCLMIYYTGKEIKNSMLGILSCLIAAIYKPFIFFSIVMQKTSLGLFLFAASLYLFLFLLNNAKTVNKLVCIKIILLGVVMGLLINVRSNCVVIIPLMALLLLLKQIRLHTSLKMISTCLLLFFLGFGLSVLPFSIRNYQVSGDFSITPKGGFNLYIANNLQNPFPYYRPLPFATSQATEQATQFVIEASRRSDKKLTPKEASDFWTRVVIKTAMDRPMAK